MSPLSSRLAIGFSCLAHSYSHLFAPIFYVVVLVLEDEMALSHGEAVGLIVVGNLLFGLAAPLAGWLGDRWSTLGMMGLFFLGTGGGMVLTGFADGPAAIALWLAATGLFASIYHPVGMAWLVRNAVNRGLTLGVNGMFGSLGPAAAALSAGVLIDLFSWRAAFIVPGGLVAATGIAFYLLVLRGTLHDSGGDRRTDPPAARNEALRAALVMLVTIACNALAYHATQAGLPKAFAEKAGALVGEGALGISSLVAAVYLAAGTTQIVAGRLADRYPLKTVYLAGIALQAPVLMLAAHLSGGGFLAVAMLMVAANTGVLPAENALIARYAPSRWRGVVFGLKFVITFGLAGAGVMLEGGLFDLTGGFFWVFAVLAALMASGAAVALLLPKEGPKPAPSPAERAGQAPTG